MKKTFHVGCGVVGGAYIGEYEAETWEEAVELSRGDAGISLCHQCSRQCSDLEVDHFWAEDDEGGSWSEESCHDIVAKQRKRIDELERENEELRKRTNELANAIGRIECALGYAGARAVGDTAEAVRALAQENEELRCRVAESEAGR